MTSPVSISVYDFFQSQGLHSREQAQDLFAAIIQKMRRQEDIWVDFSDIDFMSRSFADELVNLKMKSKQKRLINFCCTSASVREMLEAVEHTQIEKRDEKKLPVHRFDNIDSLFKYLSGI